VHASLSAPIAGGEVRKEETVYSMKNTSGRNRDMVRRIVCRRIRVNTVHIKRKKKIKWRNISLVRLGEGSKEK
jgi:hypothetical protein